MKQNDFIAALDKALAGLKPEEKREILSDFQEHFSNGMAGGKTEDEIAQELGDPEGLAEQFTEGACRHTLQGGEKLTSRDVLAVIGLLLFDFLIALNVVGILFVVWLALWVLDAGLFVAALGCFVWPVVLASKSALSSAMSGAGVVCAGVASLALCALWSIGMYYVSRWGGKGLMAFVKLHIRIFKGGAAR